LQHRSSRLLGPHETTVYRLPGINHVTCPENDAWPQHSRWTGFRGAGHRQPGQGGRETPKAPRTPARGPSPPPASR
jgi:hypothetical protein